MNDCQSLGCDREATHKLTVVGTRDVAVFCDIHISFAKADVDDIPVLKAEVTSL